MFHITRDRFALTKVDKFASDFNLYKQQKFCHRIAKKAG